MILILILNKNNETALSVKAWTALNEHNCGGSFFMSTLSGPLGGL